MVCRVAVRRPLAVRPGVMKRILVTGNAGSGKSTLAKRIAAKHVLPLHGLDCVVWQPGWKKRAPEEKSAMISKLIDQDSWVIDGVSFDVQSRADTVVFLDVPRRVSFVRVMKRNWKYLFCSRPELPPNCPEILIIPTLYRLIWNFPKNIRPRILEQNSDFQRFYHVRSSSDLAVCLDALLASTAGNDTTGEDETVGNGGHGS